MTYVVVIGCALVVRRVLYERTLACVSVWRGPVSLTMVGLAPDFFGEDGEDTRRPL